MAEYITELNVSITDAEEQSLRAQGFKKINIDLDKGAGANPIYLWYKKGTSGAITRIQTTFIKGMDVGLIRQGYTKIPKDLNAGVRGNFIYLWYFRGSTDYDTAIVDIDVTVNANAEASKLTYGWERVGCDLNRYTCGDWIHAWVKREKQTYICDVTATDGFGIDADKFGQGYVRIDENVNMGACGDPVFIWYRQTTDPEKALKKLEISATDDEYQRFQQQNLGRERVNLNQGTKNHEVYLWYRKDHGNPIKAAAVLVNPKAPQDFAEAGVRVIDKNLNAGNDGHPVFLCYYG